MTIILLSGTIGKKISIHFGQAGRDSSIGYPSAWYADDRGFDPQVRQHSFVKFGHEIISTVILSLPLIQEGQLSVTGERMCTKYWHIVNCLGSLPRNSVERLTDCARTDLRCVEGP